jgi:hypothetical protein
MPDPILLPVASSSAFLSSQSLPPFPIHAYSLPPLLSPSPSLAAPRPKRPHRIIPSLLQSPTSLRAYDLSLPSPFPPPSLPASTSSLARAQIHILDIAYTTYLGLAKERQRRVFVKSLAAHVGCQTNVAKERFGQLGREKARKEKERKGVEDRERDEWERLRRHIGKRREWEDEESQRANAIGLDSTQQETYIVQGACSSIRRDEVRPGCRSDPNTSAHPRRSPHVWISFSSPQTDKLHHVSIYLVRAYHYLPISQLSYSSPLASFVTHHASPMRLRSLPSPSSCSARLAPTSPPHHHYYPRLYASRQYTNPFQRPSKHAASFRSRLERHLLVDELLLSLRVRALNPTPALTQHLRLLPRTGHLPEPLPLQPERYARSQGTQRLSRAAHFFPPRPSLGPLPTPISSPSRPSPPLLPLIHGHC